MAKIDLTGKRFGRLIAIKDVGRDKYMTVLWECKCDCGNMIIVRRSSLTGCNTKSCGCLQKDTITTHGMTNTPVFEAWHAMIQRCTNKNSIKYKDYGERGISICKEWMVFINFFNDMGNRPSEDYSIDRINNDGNYEKSNCRWATRTEQQRNRRLDKRNKTGFTGVSLNKYNKKYKAYISFNNKQIKLGTFNTLAEAATARKQAEIKYWGKECH